MAPKIAIVYWSLYGHIQTMAEAEAEGLKKGGADVTIFQLPETLPQEVLQKMGAPPKTDKYQVLEDPGTLESFDGILFGIPTRYGTFPEQFKAFWDKTGKQWQTGGFAGKFAGVFVSTASQGGGQEETATASLSTFAHHGFIIVPMGYAPAFAQLTNLSEVRGGSSWGAGTFAGGDGSRQPTPLELEVANIQGEHFAKTVGRATK